MFKFNIFNRKQAAKTAQSLNIQSTSDHNLPPVDLFIDSNPPGKPELARPQTLPNKLSLFLEQDYYSVGKRDGYLYHSKEMLQNWKRKIRSEFFIILDQMNQDKNEQRLTFLNHQVSVGSMHETTSSQLTNILKELKASMDQLELQKELAVDEEGWIMSPIHNYYHGFTQGLNDYMEAEILLKSIKSI